MGRLLMYPERKRCWECKHYFDFTVIMRLYCSRECAGLPERSFDVEQWPRTCRVWRDGVWEAKAVYLTPEEAQGAADLHKKHWYACMPPEGCGTYHISKYTAPRTQEGA